MHSELRRCQAGCSARTACRAQGQARKHRVDKVLSNLAYCTRRECKSFLKQHTVTEGDRLLRSGSDQVRALAFRTTRHLQVPCTPALRPISKRTQASHCLL